MGGGHSSYVIDVLVHKLDLFSMHYCRRCIILCTILLLCVLQFYRVPKLTRLTADAELSNLLKCCFDFFPHHYTKLLAHYFSLELEPMLYLKLQLVVLVETLHIHLCHAIHTISEVMQPVNFLCGGSLVNCFLQKPVWQRCQKFILTIFSLQTSKIKAITIFTSNHTKLVE